MKNSSMLMIGKSSTTKKKEKLMVIKGQIEKTTLI